MKKKLLNTRSISLILAGVLVFSACKKNKDEDPAANLVGIWTASTTNFAAKIGDKTLTQYFVDVMGYSQSDAQLSTNLYNFFLQQLFTGTIQFNANNSYTSTLGGTTETGTWSLSADGKKLTIVPAPSTTSDGSTTGATVLDVVLLTANTLQVHSVDTFSNDVNGDDIDETIVTEIDITFKK